MVGVHTALGSSTFYGFIGWKCPSSHWVVVVPLGLGLAILLNLFCIGV